MGTGTGAMKNCATGSMSISFPSEADNGKGAGYNAAIRMVHVGDCMGILVCDEDIAWRSEEIWCRECFLISVLDSLRFFPCVSPLECRPSTLHPA